MRTPVQKNRGASDEVRRRNKVWWLHPRFAAFFGVVLLIGAYLVQESTYLTLYRTEKRVDLDFVMVGLIVYAGFAVGSFFSVALGSGSQVRDLLAYCRWVIWPLFGLTVFGYTVWFASAVIEAGGPGPLLGEFNTLLFDPTPGTTEYVKFELFATIPGITTLTQLGILYTTVEALLWVNGRSRTRTVLLRASVVLMLTLARAVLVSERLALIEVAIPAVVILASAADWRGARRKLISLAPVSAGAGVFGLFALGEYFRSWSYYQNIYSGSYLSYAAERFLGYYATSVNNASVFYYYEPLRPLRHTLGSLFDSPIIGGLASGYYSAFTGVETAGDGSSGGDGNYSLLEAYANPEFNNVPLVGLLLNEYSVFLAPVAAFLLGLLATSLYNSFLKGRMVGALLYPSWFVGLLEISRVYYWPGGRYFPILAFLLISLVLFKAAKTPVKSPAARNRPRRPERTLERR